MDNRIEKLMNFCEFKLTSRGLLYKDAIVIEDDGHVATRYPEVDLNFLFKYPVVKLKEYDFAGIYFLPLADGRWHVKIDILPDGYECVNINPAEALLEDVIQVIDKEE